MNHGEERNWQIHEKCFTSPNYACYVLDRELDKFNREKASRVLPESQNPSFVPRLKHKNLVTLGELQFSWIHRTMIENCPCIDLHRPAIVEFVFQICDVILVGF